IDKRLLLRYHYKHAVIYYPSTVMPSESGHPGRPTGSGLLDLRFRARTCPHVRPVPVLSRALAPLRPLAGGGGGGGPARPGREGEGGSSAVGTEGSPHLTPTLSAPKGGEGDTL